MRRVLCEEIDLRPEEWRISPHSDDDIEDTKFAQDIGSYAERNPDIESMCGRVAYSEKL